MPAQAADLRPNLRFAVVLHGPSLSQPALTHAGTGAPDSDPLWRLIKPQQRACLEVRIGSELESAATKLVEPLLRLKAKSPGSM